MSYGAHVGGGRGGWRNRHPARGRVHQKKSTTEEGGNRFAFREVASEILEKSCGNVRVEADEIRLHKRGGEN